MIIWFFLLFSFQKEKGEKSTNWLVRAIVLEFACILQLKKNAAKSFPLFHSSDDPEATEVFISYTCAKKTQNKTTKKQHCVKSIQIRSFSGPYFITIGLNIEIYLVFSLNVGKNRTEKLQIRTLSRQCRLMSCICSRVS